MTVAELIAKLQTMPQDAQVYVWDNKFERPYKLDPTEVKVVEYLLNSVVLGD